MRIKSSTKIAVGFVAIVAAGVFGFHAYSAYRVGNLQFNEIEPGELNLVGVDLGKGFRIVVANHVAELVEGTSTGPTDTTSPEDTERKRIPIKELLKSLQGDEEALGKFVSIVNGFKENDLPPERIIWSQTDLEKALAGDTKTKARLEDALNVKLDGTPLDHLDTRALENGIVLEVVVPVRVSVAGVPRKMNGKVLIPFKARLLQSVEERYSNKAVVRKEDQAGYYREEAQKVLRGDTQKQDVAQAIREKISERSRTSLAEAPERILGSAKIIVNEKFIDQASLSKTKTAKGDLYSLTIRTNGEGSDRLWQYSRNRLGKQILLIERGTAIAAPQIEHELSQSELTIDQMQDADLAQEAVDLINGKSKPK